MGAEFTVTTANTHMGRMLEDLEPVAHSDILLLQEVHPERDNLESKLAAQTDLRLVMAAGEYGLAIAVRPEITVRATQGYTLQARGPGGRTLLAVEKQWQPAAYRTRARGLVTADLAMPGGRQLLVGNTHPIVPVKWRARSRQVVKLGEILEGLAERMVIAGDMNHWPGPRAVDVGMCRRAGLERVDFGTEPTYDISASRRAWLGRVAGRLIQFDGQMDAMLYKGAGLWPKDARLVKTRSDHRALSAGFVWED